MESGTFPKTPCFVRFFSCSSGFTLSSYRKKLPLSSVFNPHEHELSKPSQPGERPAAAGGSRPIRQNQTTRPRGRREETDEVPNQKPNGLWPQPCQPGFWRSFSRGNGLPRQGGAVPSGKIKRPGHEAGERKPMKCRIKSQTDFGRSLVNRAFGAASAGGTACRGRGSRPARRKPNDRRNAGERKPMKHNTKNRKGAAA